MNTTAAIVYETFPDLCPVCRSHGMAPCYDEAGAEVPDHDGRPVALAAAGGVDL